MTADYAAALEHSRVWVLESGDAIVGALLDTDGNKAEAARQLGMSRATIYRKIRGYGLAAPDGP